MLANLSFASSSACDEVREICRGSVSAFTSVQEVASTIDTLMASVSACSAPQAEYEEVLAVTDKFILDISKTALYGDLIVKNYEKLMDSSPEGSDIDLFKKKLHGMGGWDHYHNRCPVNLLECPAADLSRFNSFQLFAGSFDGQTMMYGLGALSRHLVSIGCQTQTRGVLKRAASVSYLFFSEKMLDSPAYLTNNYFQAREGREDIADALIELRALYPKVSSPVSRMVLLKYAGALRMGFSTIEGTTGGLIWDIRKPLLLEDPDLTQPFLSRMSNIVTATALFVKGKAKSPESERIPYPLSGPVEVVITEEKDEDEVTAAPASAEGLAQLALVEDSAAPETPTAPRQVDATSEDIEWFEAADAIASVVEAIHQVTLEELGVALMPTAEEHLQGDATWLLRQLAREMSEQDESVVSPLLMRQETEEQAEDDMEGLD